MSLAVNQRKHDHHIGFESRYTHFYGWPNIQKPRPAVYAVQVFYVTHRPDTLIYSLHSAERGVTLDPVNHNGILYHVTDISDDS